MDAASARRIVEEFLAAAMSGRTERLVEMLTSDVTAVSDGAGLAHRLLRCQTLLPAARRRCPRALSPVQG